MIGLDPVLASLIPFALGGGFQLLSVFLETEENFEKRERQICCTLKERVAKSLETFIRETARTEGFDNIPRGDGVSTHDPYGEVAEVIAKHALLSIRAERRLLEAARCHFVFFWGCIAGIVAFLASQAASLLANADLLKQCIAWTCFGVATLQVLSAVYLRTLIARSKTDEKIA